MFLQRKISKYKNNDYLLFCIRGTSYITFTKKPAIAGYIP